MKTVTAVSVLVAMFLMTCWSPTFAQGKVKLVNQSDYNVLVKSGVFTSEFLTPGDETPFMYVSTKIVVASILYGKGSGQTTEEGEITLRLTVPTNSNIIVLTNSDIVKAPAKKAVKFEDLEETVYVQTEQPANFTSNPAYVQAVWVINATNERMEGKTGAFRGMLLTPTSIAKDSVTGFYSVGPNLFYDPVMDEFYDNNQTLVTNEEVGKLINTQGGNIAQFKVPLGPIEDNLKCDQGADGIARATILERLITQNTRAIVITDADLNKYQLDDRARKRTMINRSTKEFHFVFGEGKQICPARRSIKKPGFANIGRLSSGIYYLEATFIKGSKIVTRDVLIILSSVDKYVVVHDNNLDAPSWTGQKAL